MTTTPATYYHDPAAPVQPLQLAPEFKFLLTLFREKRPERILEIGVGEGGTLYQWLCHAPAGAMVVAVDLPGGPWGTPNSAHPVAWGAWASWHRIHLLPILGSSQDEAVVARVANRKPFDWIFVDGDHSYEGVRADFENYWPLLAGDGVMAFHDIVEHEDPNMGVHRLWRELRRGNWQTEELISFKGQREMGIGIVCK